MNDETLREKYQAVQPVGDYGIPFRPDNLMFFPKALNNATARFPVFSVPDKDKPYQYTETIKTINVTRFYVKHHPKGYKPEHEEYGDGSETNPFLDFKNACSKIDCFLNNSCRGKVQIIIMDGSSPLDSSCSHHFVAPLRVILGATDEQLYFEVSEDCEFAVKMISQCKASANKNPYVSQFSYSGDFFFKRGVNNASPIYKHHGGFLLEVALEHEKYTRLDVLFPAYGSYVDLSELDCDLTYTKIVTQEGTRQFSSNYMLQTKNLDADGNLVVEWQDGQRTVFIKKNNTTWVLPGVFHAPDLLEYYDCKATSYSAGVFDIEGKYRYKDALTRVQPAVWHFANTPQNEEWTSAGGAIYTLKDGKPDEYVTTVDLFLYRAAQNVKPIYWKCKNISIEHGWSYDTDVAIVADCEFENNHVIAHLMYNCKAYKVWIDVPVVDMCSLVEPEHVDSDVVNRSSVTAETLSSGADAFYHCTFDVKNLNLDRCTIVRSEFSPLKTLKLERSTISYCDINSAALCGVDVNYADHSTFTITDQKCTPVFYGIDTCTFRITYTTNIIDVGGFNDCIYLIDGGFCYNTEIKVTGKATIRGDGHAAGGCVILNTGHGNTPILSNVTIDTSAIEYSVELDDGQTWDDIGCFTIRIYDIGTTNVEVTCFSGCTVKQWGNDCDD